MLPPATRAVLFPQRATPSIVSSAKGLPSFPAAFGGFSGKVAGRLALPLAIYDTAKSVGWDQQGNFNPKIIRELGALGTSIENLSTGKPSSAGRTQAQQQNSGRPVGTQAVLGGKPVYWGGEDYGWQQLNQSGSSATLNSLNTPGTQSQFIQDSLSASPAGASPVRGPGASSFTPLDPYAAQNREYERERARVEAMVKANPDMQKQAIADERAKVRDQGMALWAKANPTLAKQVQPGAVGYDAIQRGIGIQELPSLENRAEFTWNQATQGPTPAVPMADPMLNPAGPGFIGGEGAPPVNFADPRFENMSPEEFQKLLNQYTKR
jgi:hypothetical protein